ncbi:MAG: exodeoxyribonuclease VII small subunit [Gemmatimonadota bacterium]
MNSQTDVSFENSLKELERIVGALDRDELELSQALKLFSEGIEHLRSASRCLDAARGSVEELIEGAEGDLTSIGIDRDFLEPKGV